MNFRFEDKLKLDKNKIFEFKDWLTKNRFREIFKPREIFSIYFDTKYNQTYHDSNEGIVPRSKLRLRTYNFKSLKKNKFNIEIKKSINHGRLKSTKILNNYEKSLKLGIFLKNYGFCYPKIIIKYNRSYYKYKNIRLTLDKNIKFENFTKSLNNSMVSKTSDLIVAEIKYSSGGDSIELFHKLPFEKTRFSKYCIGLETLNLV